MWVWPCYMSFGKSRVSEHVVSWAQLLVCLSSSRCSMIGILSTSSTMYQTNCGDGTLASLSWTHLGANIPLCMDTLTYTNIILERTSIIIPIGWACNWKKEYFLRDWNHEWPPKSLLDLFEGFLARMPLHRLAHFLDMVLPQLSPLHTRWDDPRKTLLCCHFFRLARTNVFAQVRLQFLSTSRAFIYMVRISWKRQSMLLFSDIHRVDPVSFRRFHEDRFLGKHNIQMGLLEGHSILLHFFNNGRAYQAVLVSMSSAPSKSKKGKHAMWKHVLPVSTDFAWLPEDVADAFCSLVLHQDPTRPYSSFYEVQLGFNEHYQALLHIEGLYYLGETRSVDEFNIFSQMPAERLCLGCGVQPDERFGLMPPQDRGKLFAATLRIMQVVLTDRLQDVTDDEEQIRQALHLLVYNRDGHFLATLSALLLSLLQSKTDYPISGVFGAGKTTAAAAIIAGLITVDPFLKIMILTKKMLHPRPLRSTLLDSRYQVGLRPKLEG